MSLVPLLFSDWWEDLDRPHRLFDQHFGSGLHPQQLMVEPRWSSNNYLSIRPPLAIYQRPWKNLLAETDKGTSTVKSDKDKFQVVLDVEQFKPEEIDVKVVDNFVVVNAKHEEQRDEHGWISREFTRKYLIPQQCNIEQVSSKLSSDGVLTITAPRKEAPKLKNEKVVKIEHTGKPALKNTEAPKHSDKKTDKK